MTDKKKDIRLEYRSIDFIQIAATLLPHRYDNLRAMSDDEVVTSLHNLTSLVKQTWLRETVSLSNNPHEDIMDDCPE